MAKWAAIRLAEVSYKIELLKRKLSKMKEDQDRSIRIIESLPALRAQAREHDLGLLLIIENGNRKLQVNTNEYFQFKLELQIHLLQTEMTYLNEGQK